MFQRQVNEMFAEKNEEKQRFCQHIFQRKLNAIFAENDEKIEVLPKHVESEHKDDPTVKNANLESLIEVFLSCDECCERFTD